MARNKNSDFFSDLRSSGLRKSVARALADLESGGRDARGNAEKLGRRVIDDLRSAADSIEKRLNIGGAGTRATAAKKAPTTRKRTTKRSPAAKKGASTRARKTTARKTTSSGARKTTARKTTGSKTTARKTTARKSTKQS